MLNNEKLELNNLNKAASYNKKESSKENSEEEEDNEFKPHDIQDHYYDPIDNRNEYRDPDISTVKDSVKIIRLLSNNKKIDLNQENKIKTETNEYYEKFKRYQNRKIYRWNVKTIKDEIKAHSPF